MHAFSGAVQQSVDCQHVQNPMSCVVKTSRTPTSTDVGALQLGGGFSLNEQLRPFPVEFDGTLGKHLIAPSTREGCSIATWRRHVVRLDGTLCRDKHLGYFGLCLLIKPSI